MKQAAQILQILQEKFAGKIISSDMAAVDPTIVVAVDSIAEISFFLKNNEELSFDSLMCLSGVDYKGLKGETDRLEPGRAPRAPA